MAQSKEMNSFIMPIVQGLAILKDHKQRQAQQLEEAKKTLQQMVVAAVMQRGEK